MLACRECLWRCLRAVCPDLPARHPLSRAIRLQSSSSRISTRYASSLARERAWERDGTIPITTVNEQARPALRSERDTGDADVSRSTLRHVKLELPWLEGDRLKLLTRTKELLADGEKTKALELVKSMSKIQECTISWNAVIEGLMRANGVPEAFKVYNDMKKRGQLPDFHTFMHLFKGLEANAKTAGVARRAVALWRSLSRENCAVKPNIALTNAALQVCVSAGDNEALWSIAGAIPEQGDNVADVITYSIILRAIRKNVEFIAHEIKEMTTEQAHELDTAVAQGRQIWGDIVARWTAGKLRLDEVLVCEMGRLLLASRHEQDLDDIFSLVAQTMNIPRQVAVLQLRKPRSKPLEENAWTRDAGEAESPPQIDQDIFAMPQKQRDLKDWVQPTNNTLMLLSQACDKMYLEGPMNDYWELLTYRKGHNIRPDSANWHTRLRFLRRARASGEALELVRARMGNMTQGKTYRIAVSTCVRNQSSPRAFKEATKLVQLMLERLDFPDVKASTMYMKLALDSPPEPDTYTAIQLLTPQRFRLGEIMRRVMRRDDDGIVPLLEFAKAMVSGFDRVIASYQARMAVGKGNSSSSTGAGTVGAGVPSSSDIPELQRTKAVWTKAVQSLIERGEKGRGAGRSRLAQTPSPVQQVLGEEMDGKVEEEEGKEEEQDGRNRGGNPSSRDKYAKTQQHDQIPERKRRTQPRRVHRQAIVGEKHTARQDGEKKPRLRDRYAWKQQLDQIREKKRSIFEAARSKSSSSLMTREPSGRGFSDLPSEI